MNWDIFVENVKIFWNQPIPIIGFTVGTVVTGILFIIGRTSIGNKALNKIKDINNFITEKNNILLESCEEYSKKLKDAEETVKEILAKKDEEIKKLKDEYELKLTNYREQLLKQENMIRVICENSVNKKIKDVYEKYNPTQLELPVGELKVQIEEKVKVEYEDRIARLEELVYGEREKTTDNQTTSE